MRSQSVWILALAVACGVVAWWLVSSDDTVSEDDPARPAAAVGERAPASQEHPDRPDDGELAGVATSRFTDPVARALADAQFDSPVEDSWPGCLAAPGQRGGGGDARCAS